VSAFLVKGHGDDHRGTLRRLELAMAVRAVVVQSGFSFGSIQDVTGAGRSVRAEVAPSLRRRDGRLHVGNGKGATATVTWCGC
jgi:hypothetical protein